MMGDVSFAEIKDEDLGCGLRWQQNFPSCTQILDFPFLIKAMNFFLDIILKCSKDGSENRLLDTDFPRAALAFTAAKYRIAEGGLISQ